VQSERSKLKGHLPCSRLLEAGVGADGAAVGAADGAAGGADIHCCKMNTKYP